MDSAYSTQPIAPTQGLPKLAFLASASTTDIKSALDNLKALYFPAETPSPIPDELSRQASKVLCSSPMQPKAVIVSSTRVDGNATPVPDSGYASADEDEDEEEERTQHENTLSILRFDPFERTYALKWLTGFVGRSDIWLSRASSDDDESERAEVVEEAVKLINAFSDGVLSSLSPAGDRIDKDDTDDGSIVRSFSFHIPAISEITVHLNDAPLSSSDHTSVGLQSWGSSIILAERMCADPDAFSILPAAPDAKPLHVLELGAGTGLLSITASKIAELHSTRMTIAATDYHPDVLTNLASNVATNASSSSPSTSPAPAPSSATATISVHKFDWEHPDYQSPPFDAPFDVILAADVVYYPLHAAWIKSCAEALLRKPGLRSQLSKQDEERERGGVFWLMIPIRTTGRHEGMHRTVESAFSVVSGGDCHVREGGEGTWELAILEMEVVARREGTGRADESGYRLYKIGWVLRV